MTEQQTTSPPLPPPPAGLRARWRTLIGEPGTGRRVLARNGAYDAASFVVHAVVAFFLCPFLIAHLGRTPYGIWSLVTALTGYFGFADLGVRPAIVHFIARHDALAEPSVVNRYVSSAFATFAAGGALVLGVALAAPLWLPHVANEIPADLVPAARTAILLVGVDFAIALPLQAFSAVLVGKQRIDLLNRVNFATLALRTTAIVVLVSNGHGLVALAAANLGASAFEMTAKSVLAFRVLPTLRLDLKGFDRASAKSLLKYGGLAIPVAIALHLTWQTDAIVIGAMLYPTAITFFDPGARLASYTRSLLWSMGRALTPAVSALDARGERREIERMLVHSTRNLLLLAGPILVYLLTLGRPFLARWLGEDFRGPSGDVLAILALGAAAPIASYPCVAYLYGTNRLKPLALLLGAEGITNLGVSLALAKPYGIQGVALGTALPGFVVHFVLLPQHVCRRIGIGWGAFTLRTYATPVLAGGAAYLALRALSSSDASYGWAALAAFSALSVVVYALAAFAATRLARPRAADGAAQPVEGAAR